MSESASQNSFRSYPKHKHAKGLSALALTAACPCQSEEPVSKTYGECCGLWHQGLQAQPPRFAPTVDALMRSRYSAYALKLGAYLLATWYSETSPGDIDFPPTKWLGLDVKSSAESGDVGMVEFVARYRDSMGRAGRIEETSRFVREGAGEEARWYYIDGITEPEPQA